MNYLKITKEETQEYINSIMNNEIVCASSTSYDAKLIYMPKDTKFKIVTSYAEHIYDTIDDAVNAYNQFCHYI